MTNASIQTLFLQWNKVWIYITHLWNYGLPFWENKSVTKRFDDLITEECWPKDEYDSLRMGNMEDDVVSPKKVDQPLDSYLSTHSLSIPVDGSTAYRLMAQPSRKERSVFNRFDWQGRLIAFSCCYLVKRRRRRNRKIKKPIRPPFLIVSTWRSWIAIQIRLCYRSWVWGALDRSRQLGKRRWSCSISHPKCEDGIEMNIFFVTEGRIWGNLEEEKSVQGCRSSRTGSYLHTHARFNSSILIYLNFFGSSVESRYFVVL